MPTDKQATYVCSMCQGACTIVENQWTCTGCGSTGFLDEATREPLDGAKLLELRTELKWSRRELSESTSLTISRICRIENGQHIPTPGESDLIERTLLGTLHDTLDKEQKKKVDLIKYGEVTRSGSWNGITRGDLVSIRGESGAFRFLYHHEDPTQEYVEVFGPVNGKKGVHMRSFTTDKVRRTGRKA